MCTGSYLVDIQSVPHRSSQHSAPSSSQHSAPIQFHTGRRCCSRPIRERRRSCLLAQLSNLSFHHSSCSRPYPRREVLLRRVWAVGCTPLGWGGESSRPSFGYPRTPRARSPVVHLPRSLRYLLARFRPLSVVARFLPYLACRGPPSVRHCGSSVAGRSAELAWTTMASGDA